MILLTEEPTSSERLGLRLDDVAKVTRSKIK